MTTTMRSADGRFGLVFGESVRAELLGHVTRAGSNETGGVLVGHYSEACDCAVVTRVVGPPKDSTAGRTWFVRGVCGLTRLLADCWQRNQGYYLGEWHFHPGGSPCPSPRDNRQMHDIAVDVTHCCPQPVLLLLGGSGAADLRLGAFVYPVGEPVVGLLER